MAGARGWIPGLRRDFVLLAAPYALVILIGLAISTPGIYMLNAARAYVTGEGLYSKAQKRAVLHLTRYARTADPAEWRAYEAQIAVPRADGEALAALQQDPPDMATARDAMLRGRNHPDDISGMLRLFAWAPWMPEMQDAIRAWETGDALVRQLDANARELRHTLGTRPADPARVDALLQQIAYIDAELSEVEADFSYVLGAGARRLHATVIAAAWGAGLLLLAIGVLASRRIATSIRRRDEVFRSMIERAHDIITILRPDGRVVYNSPSLTEHLGHPAEEIYGKSGVEWVHPDDRPRVVEALGSALRESTAVDYRIRARDGSWRDIASTGAPFPLPDGTRGIVMNSRDVTEERQLERRLVEAERMESIGRLAGGVAHDFNNLISIIAGTAALARSDEALPSELRADFDAIDDACERAGQLTGQLVTFARREVLEPTVLDANAALRDLDPMLRRFFDDSIELVLELCDGTAPVRADRAQLDRLIVNLTVNAAEAMPDGGAIHISTAICDGDPGDTHDGSPLASGPCLRLDVCNDGEPIPADVRAHLFEPFFTTKAQGTGLGLSTCYGIVRQNGGTISVDSEPDKPTRFRIRWPLADASQLKERAAAPQRAEPGSETILCVDDEAPLRRVLARLLGRAGYRVVAAGSGAEALELAASEPSIDLLLSDVSMPGMNGRELADRLRELRPALPVVFMSGYTEDEALKDQVGARHAHFVAKPFDPDGLLQRLRDVLDGR